MFTYNTATGRGANPSRSGMPGGWRVAGGATLLDGNRLTLDLAGCTVGSNVDRHLRVGGHVQTPPTLDAAPNRIDMVEHIDSVAGAASVVCLELLKVPCDDVGR